MLTAGDEIARTQRGNNNAYCQDNAVSWVDWTIDEARGRLLAFVRRAVELRRAHPAFKRRHFFEGRSLHGTPEDKDIAWLKPDGTEMTEQEWNNGFARCLGVFLAGDRLGETDARGRAMTDDDFIVLFNAHDGPIAFTLPAFNGFGWLVLLDTARDEGLSPEGTFRGDNAYQLEPRSLALLQKVSPS
jgi:glycogen operon protein